MKSIAVGVVLIIGSIFLTSDPPVEADHSLGVVANPLSTVARQQHVEIDIKTSKVTGTGPYVVTTKRLLQLPRW